MAVFLIAYKKTGKVEGRWANDPDDSGGETWEGISRNNEPNWIGWHIIDMHKKLPNFPENLKASNELEIAVQSLFERNYWMPIKGDQIKSQEIANDFYDAAVNLGVGEAIILENRNKGLKETSHMTDQLLNVLNNIS